MKPNLKSNGLLIFAFAVVVFWVSWTYFRGTHHSQEVKKKPNEIYVWNRVWNRAVHAALQNVSAKVDRLVVLAAQVDHEDGAPRITEVPVNWEWLKETGVTVGLAIRIGSYNGSFENDTETFRAIVKAASASLSRLKGKKPTVTLRELQIDFDCPESKLSGYQKWIEALQETFKDVPITLTALPSWLRHSEFADLVGASDGFVLQVHSLEVPERIEDEVDLFDPGKAIRWVRQASMLGAPFRVALPTYGYRLHFGDDGRYLGLSAENYSDQFRGAPRTEIVDTDPVKVAKFLKELRGVHAPSLEGVIWFRMPIEGDEMNWAWPTLAALIDGETPKPELEVLLETKDNGHLADLFVSNKGNAKSSSEFEIVVSCDTSKLIAMDSLGGFQINQARPNELVFNMENERSEGVKPNGRLPVGWLRFDEIVEVKAHVVEKGH